MSIDVSITQPPIRITSAVTLKRIAAYYTKAHKTRPLHVHLLPEEHSLLMTDGFTFLKVSMCPELAVYAALPVGTSCAVFEKGNLTPQPTTWNLLGNWEQFMQDIVRCQLTLTYDLKEIAGERNKHGTFYRKFLRGGEEDSRKARVWVDMCITDLLSPDLDELEGFHFEQMQGNEKIRVAGRAGYLGFIMPGINIER